jgi:hypothetical protein
MFALLQIYPAEATVPLTSESGEAGDDCGVDVLAVDDSEERLERFAVEYEERYWGGVSGMDAVGRYRP